MLPPITINIHAFLQEFNDLYRWLYNYGNDTEIEEAAHEYDYILERNKSFAEFVGEFVKFRGDAITSDREAAAFMGAMDKFA